MIADPKDPFDGTSSSQDRDEVIDSVDTTLAASTDDPVDVVAVEEAETQTEPGSDVKEDDPETGASQQSSGGRGLLVVLLVVLSLAAAAAGAIFGPNILNPDAGNEHATLKASIATLQNELDALKTVSQGDAGQSDRLSALETKVEALEGLEARVSDAELGLSALAADVPTADGERLDALAARIDSLEAASTGWPDGGAGDAAGSSDDFAALRDRTRALIARMEALPEGGLAALAGLDERLAALEAATDGNSAALGRVAGLNDAVGQLRDQITTLSASLDALENRAIDPASAFVLATSQLEDAVSSGEPYPNRLEATASLAPEDEAVTASLLTLAGHADTGVATTKSLGERLPGAISDAITAEHIATSEGWVDQTLSQLEGLVRVRRVDGEVEGSHAEAVTARAEARSNDGDLDGAVKELEGLSDAAKEAMASWIADARDHLNVHQALQDLLERAIVLVAGEAN